MKVLQFGDVHAEDSKIDFIRPCLEFIAEQAEAENPDLIICTGDTFNSAEVKLDSKAAKLVFEIFSRLANVAPVVVDIGTPSHDGTAAEVLKHVAGRYPVRVATAPMQEDIGGATVSIIPAPTKQFMQGSGTVGEGDSQISAALSAVFAGFGASGAFSGDNPCILVGHWAVTGCKMSANQDYIGREISIGYDQMLLAQPDLICLGHIHMAQKMGDRCFYNGSIYRKDYGEMEPKGFYIHELHGKRLHDSRFIETPSRKLYKIERDATTGFLYPLANSAVAGCHVRYEVTCWQDEAKTIPIEEIETSCMACGAASVDVRLIRMPRQTVRADIVLKAVTLREKLVAMAELRGETVAESILLKADAMEAYGAEQMIQVVAGGVGSLELEKDAA